MTTMYSSVGTWKQNVVVAALVGYLVSQSQAATVNAASQASTAVVSERFMSTLDRMLHTNNQARENTCGCNGANCVCCNLILSQQACLNSTYDSTNSSISASFKLGDSVLFDQSLSASNPPPICYPIPPLPIVGACVRFYNIHLIDLGLYACVKVDFLLFNIYNLYTLNLDCFTMNGSGYVTSKPKRSLLPNAWASNNDGDLHPSLSISSTTTMIGLIIPFNDEDYSSVNVTMNPVIVSTNDQDSLIISTKTENAMNISANTTVNSTVLSIKV